MISSIAPGQPGCTACRTRERPTGPESVWDALTSLGAERIEHGIGAVGDPRLLEHLAEHEIALDVCLTSNVALRVVPRP